MYGILGGLTGIITSRKRVLTMCHITVDVTWYEGIDADPVAAIFL
jgi:hypothetical protein